MKWYRALVGTVMTVAVAGCSSELTSLPIGDLGGIWISTSYTFTDNATGMTSRDLAAADGARLTLSIDNTQAPPTVAATFDNGLGGGWNDTGVVDIVAAELSIGAGVFGIVHDGNQMTLTNAGSFYIFPTIGNQSTTLVIELDRL